MTRLFTYAERMLNLTVECRFFDLHAALGDRPCFKRAWGMDRWDSGGGWGDVQLFGPGINLTWTHRRRGLRQLCPRVELSLEHCD